VLIDTCIWSLSLRRRQDTSDNPIVTTLVNLIQQQRAVILGAIRQEVLSGVRSSQQFEWLRIQLRKFEDFPMVAEDYERAAEFFNSCRAKGVQGSPTDFLLCAVAQRHQFAIFTTDKDFEYFRRHLEFPLYTPPVVAYDSG
jgi:hypothetical protein